MPVNPQTYCLHSKRDSMRSFLGTCFRRSGGRFLLPVLFTVNLMLYFLFLPGFAIGQTDSTKYHIEFIQEGIAVPVVDNKVSLRNAPFQIQITLYNHDGVFMSASFGEEYFSLGDSLPIPDFAYLNAKTRAEHPFNSDRELPIDGETVSFLFYDPAYDWHRFDDSIVIDGDKVVGTKSIEKLYIEATGDTIELRDFSGSLYLFFVATTAWPQTGEAPLELGRKFMELVFETN